MSGFREKVGHRFLAKIALFSGPTQRLSCAGAGPSGSNGNSALIQFRKAFAGVKRWYSVNALVVEYRPAQGVKKRDSEGLFFLKLTAILLQKPRKKNFI